MGDETPPLDLNSTVPADSVRENPPVRPDTKAYNPAQDRERKRGQMATWLIALLAALTLAPLLIILTRGICVASVGTTAGTCSGLPDIDLMAVLQLVVTPVVALVGAATGFYFGDKTSNAET